jgi:hypothetical protein
MEKMDKIFSKMASHLEFFGYEHEIDEEDSYIRAEHEGYGRVFIRRMGRIMLHSNYWHIGEHASSDDLELLMIINRLNQSNYVSTYSIMDDGGLRIDAVFTGEYSKVSYGEFIDDFHQDIVRAIRADEQLRQYRDKPKLASVN